MKAFLYPGSSCGNIREQLRVFRDHANNNGWSVVDNSFDCVASCERPDDMRFEIVREIIKQAKKGSGHLSDVVLVVESLDRLSSQPLVPDSLLSTLLKAGLRIAVVGTGEIITWETFADQ